MILMALIFMTMVLQRPDTSSLSSSSLQRWQVAPLCNGKYKVVNFFITISAWSFVYLSFLSSIITTFILELNFR